MAKLSIDYVKNECLKRDIEFVDGFYINNNFKHNFRCLRHNQTCKSIIRSVISGNNRLSCCGSGMPKHSIEYVKSECLKRGFEFLSSDYCGINVKHIFKCIKHKETHTAQPRQVLLGDHGLKCCGSEKLKGSNNHNWNPNLSEKERSHRRNGYLSSKWANEVKLRDNYTCQACNKNIKSQSCVSHHLESYAHNKDLRYDVDNGVCTCYKCHEDFHKIYGYGKNTKSQFNKFKTGNFK